MFKTLKRNNCPPQLWNQTAERITSAWAWHRSELLDARQTWTRTFDQSFAVVDANTPSNILALVPIVLIRTRYLTSLVGPHLEGTGGPVIDNSLPRRTKDKLQSFIVDELNILSTQHHARRVDLSCPPLAPDLLDSSVIKPNPLCHFGTKDASTQSWVLQLFDKSEDQLWRSLEHRCRKQVNKAQRHQLSAEIVTPDPGLLDTYYKLHQQTCLRNGIPTHPRAYFEEIFGPVSRSGLCQSCIVRQGHDILTIHNFLIYKGAALYWTTAGNDEALHLCANDFGIWHAITEFRDKGIKFLECGEAFPGARGGKLKGLNDFKKSFGGELYPYFRGQIVYRPITESLMEIARQLRKRRTDK